ncbi:unnamed protein product [Ranitomeya imitator]|uniref:Helix-turn-helix domain-containing protein n=1 Tax=Ranitomeya imitator TaxID=111125 RepID=A0ABN9L1N0_9NEOB|nr:unnamed protein product [Ranitomeya imitator]
MAQLNRNSLNIKLTYKAHRHKIDFLDISLEVDGMGTLHTDVYRKTTSVNALLHASSSHTSHTIKAIPVGQFLRMRRICSTDQKFEVQAENLKDRFKARGYSNRCIKRAYLRAKNTERHELLFGKKKKTASDNCVRFISTYNCQWKRMQEIINSHWSILFTDPILASQIPMKPQFTAKRGKSIKDLLVKSHYVAKATNPLNPGNRGPTWGCFPCGDCLACKEKNLIRGTHFLPSDGKVKFQIRHHIGCASTYVIYMATCPCSKTYVGLTSRQLRIRVREHVRDIMSAKSAEDINALKTLPRHFHMFHGCDPKGLRILGIDQVHCGSRGGNAKRLLAQMECRWIVTLNSMAPAGLNEQLSFASFL